MMIIIIKGSIHQGDIIIVNIYAPNIRPPKYIRQVLTNLKEEIDNNTIIVGDISNSCNNVQITQTENQ